MSTMGKRWLWTIVIAFLLSACSGQNKEELLNSGISQLHNGNTRGAIVYFKNALALDPNYFEARFQLGNAYFEAGQYQQAEHEYEKVYLQKAHDSELLLKLAQVYRHTQRFDKSIEVLNLYHQDNPPSSKSLDLLGVSNALKEQYQVADSLFIKSAELDQNNPLPRYHLAQSYLGQSRNHDASTVLEQIIDNFSGFTDAYELLAELHLSERRVDDAIEIYRLLTITDPQNAQALYVRGILLLTIGRSDEALEVVAIYV